MPARMIRDNLLDSERFLSLPDNTSRICYVSCLLTADDRGNMEGGPGHLVRLWRDFGVDSSEKAAAISQFLADQDLIRFYESDDKRYLHVPRFGQRMRSFKRACPPSPWCESAVETIESFPICQQSAASSGKSPPKRREEKGREEAPSGQSLFDFAIAVLGEQGVKEKSARSFIGSLLKDWDARDVEEALRAAVGKVDAQGYVRGVLRGKPKKGQAVVKKVAL